MSCSGFYFTHTFLHTFSLRISSIETIKIKCKLITKNSKLCFGSRRSQFRILAFRLLKINELDESIAPFIFIILLTSYILIIFSRSKVHFENTQHNYINRPLCFSAYYFNLKQSSLELFATMYHNHIINTYL